MDGYASVQQNLGEGLLHISVMGGQNGVVAAEQMILNLFRTTPFGPQPVLNGQQNLHPAGAAADHSDLQLAGIRHGAMAQCLPAFEKSVDGLDGDGGLGGARHVGCARRRADID